MLMEPKLAILSLEFLGYFYGGILTQETVIRNMVLPVYQHIFRQNSCEEISHFSGT